MNKDEIMKQFDEAIKNLKEWVGEEPKESPEWEEKLSRVFDTLSPLPLEPMSETVLREQHNIKVEWLKDFIRQEFKAMGQEIIQPDNGIRELSAYPAEAYRQGIYDMKYKVKEALRKRGVE